MSRNAYSSRSRRASARRTLFHVFALVMVVVQSQPLGTALAAPTAPPTSQTSIAAAVAAVAVPCVAGSVSVTDTSEALDCALAVEEGVAVRTDLAGLVRRRNGIMPTFTIASAPQHGAATMLGSTMTYTPTAGFTGADQLVYRIADSTGRVAGGTVTMNVGERAPPATTDMAHADATTTAVAPTQTITATRPPAGTPIVTAATPRVTAITPTAAVNDEPVTTVPAPPTNDPVAQPAVASPTQTSDSGVDLAVPQVVAPASGLSTRSIVLSWSVTNKGKNAAPKHNDRLYLSTDTALGKDWDLGVLQIDQVIKTNERYTRTLTVTLPNVLNGTYYVLALADAPNRIAESNETNNLRAVPIKVRRLPDVAPSMLTAPASIVPGVPVDVRWRVGNIGGSPAAAHDDQIYLSKDALWDSADRLIASAAITQSLAMNASYTQAAKITLPAVQGGVYHLLVRTDATRKVAELDETNNVKAIAVSVTRPPVATEAAFTIGLTETVTVDLRSLVTDPDNDPLQYTIVVSPTYGTARLVTSTLTFTPTAAFTEADDLVYAVTDAWGARAQGHIRFTTTRTKLHITPGSVMLSARGQRRAVTVRAYDPLGREVPADGLGLEWMSNNSAVATVSAGGRGINATVQAVADVGTAFIAVRSRTNPDVEFGVVRRDHRHPCVGRASAAR